MAIIEVNNITKEYSLGALTSAKDTIRHTLAKLAGKQTWHREKFKALDDVSFSIEQGEVVGIIGHNGAGKSTLLKVLAKVTTPTSGSVSIKGSVAPLIEVGAGINPELTGRENIFLNASILGIPKRVIRSKMDEIIEFSELEQFIDTPVKRYSSGMQVKLGFSIATSLEAEILIIDEVLAVGDLAFQRKCFSRMEDIIKNQGRTVLLVSHNLRQVQRMCDRVLLLDHGALINDSSPDEVCNQFYAINEDKIHLNQQSKGINSTGEVDLLSITTVDQNGNPINEVVYGESVTIKLTIKVNCKISRPQIIIGIHTTDFLYLSTEATQLDLLDPGEYEIFCTIKKLPFLPRGLALRASINVGELGANILYGENLYFFHVVDAIGKRPKTGENFIKLDCKWDLRKANAGNKAVVQL